MAGVGGLAFKDLVAGGGPANGSHGAREDLLRLEAAGTGVDDDSVLRVSNISDPVSHQSLWIQGLVGTYLWS